MFGLWKKEVVLMYFVLVIRVDLDQNIKYNQEEIILGLCYKEEVLVFYEGVYGKYF